MSDEGKQLTVAELLERAQANRGSAQRASGRRRRRSLEDGGISVAELTGSLARVKEKPAESKHSSVPIDTPESERRSRPRTPSSPAATAPSVAGINATPLSGSSFKPAPSGSPAWGGAQAGAVAPKNGQGSRTGETSAANDAPARPVKASFAAPSQRVEATPEVRAKQQPAQDKPRDVRSTQGKGPWPIPDSARRTVSVQRPAATTAVPKEGEDSTVWKPKTADFSEGARESSAEKTAVISVVGGTAPRGEAKAERAKENPAEETGRIPRVGDEDSAPVASLYQGAQRPKDERERSESADPARGDREGSELKKRPKRPAEPEPRTGAGSAVLLAVMGVVFGALVFIGFDQLWSSGLSRILVGVLALAVTGIMVGVVHALRTARDGVSMTLAAVVGVLMTFGPYIPHMLS